MQHDDRGESREKVAQQLDGLAGVCGDDVEEHVNADDGIAEEEQYDDVECRHEYEWEEPPHLPPCLSRGADDESVDA